MRNSRRLKHYSVLEINGIMESLRDQYAIVRLVDVEECRVLEVLEDGTLTYAQTCFSIWGRENRCANCTSYRACLTHGSGDKQEHLGTTGEAIHSIPVYLELKNGEEELFVIECVNPDGTKRDQEEAPAEYISTHDVLTCLYTQEKLLREIRVRLNQDPKGQYLIIMSNIRNFTVVNRLFGFDGGNRILTGIADLFRRECTEDEIYGRYRDDRFLLFIRKERFDEAKFAGYLKEVQDMAESPIFSLQIRLGVYEIPNVNMPVSMMIKHAEIAVDAIRDERDIWISHYRQDMLEHKKKDKRIVSGFEEALENGEFHIYLQPQVFGRGEIRGGEALVRWIRPDGTILMPGEFLDVLAQTELLSHLDRHVWERAVRLLSKWKGTALEDKFLSVNIDPMDFYYMDVPDTLCSLCRRYEVDPKKLRVEITEAALVEDPVRQNEIIDRLHKAGFLVEIDDFGKGYSSLSMLKDIHADILKVDMGFLRENEHRERSEVILESVIEMAGNLDMGVIVEGVETKEQMEKLMKMGCQRFQGYFFSRPIPVPDFEMIAGA